MPKRHRKSSKVFRVGYPAQLILIASMTPWNMTLPSQWCKWLERKKRRGLISQTKILNLPHSEVAVKCYYSQIWLAWEGYLALHNECSVAQWHSVSLAKLAIVAVVNIIYEKLKGIREEFKLHCTDITTETDLKPRTYWWKLWWFGRFFS